MTDGTYHRGPDVAWVDADALNKDQPVVYVARVPAGRPMVLEDSAWAIWSAIGDEGGTIDEITARTADLAGLDVADLREQVITFLDTLVGQGLVVTSPPAVVPGGSAR